MTKAKGVAVHGVYYHGSPEKVKRFRGGFSRGMHGGDEGVFFAKRRIGAEEYAFPESHNNEVGYIMKTEVALKNAMTMDGYRELLWHSEDPAGEALALGYDGAVDEDSAVAFRPEKQCKILSIEEVTL